MKVLEIEPVNGVHMGDNSDFGFETATTREMARLNQINDRTDGGKLQITNVQIGGNWLNLTHQLG